jgi:hypothetical protein
VIFVVAILVIGGGPIYVSSRTERDLRAGNTFQRLAKRSDCAVRRDRFADYRRGHSRCCKSEHMSSSNASLLVAGGAITVLLLPMTATLLEPQSGQRAMNDSATTAR